MGAVARALASWITGSMLGVLASSTNKSPWAAGITLFALASSVDYFIPENNGMIIDILRGVEASSLAISATELINVQPQVVLWEETNNKVVPG